MAYSHPNLHRVGPTNSDVPTIWTYDAGTDALTVVDNSGYFNAAAADLTVGDLIYVKAAGPTYGLMVVLSNNGTVVDVSNATALGAVNSD